MEHLTKDRESCSYTTIKNKTKTFSSNSLKEVHTLGYGKQTGIGPSRRHIQGSKIAKGLPRVNLQYSKIEKAKKIDRVARRGPLARAPVALKGGHFRNCQHFCRS